MISNNDLNKITNLINYSLGKKIFLENKCFNYYKDFLDWKQKTRFLCKYDEITIENRHNFPFIFDFIIFLFFKQGIYCSRIRNLNINLFKKLFNERNLLIIRSKNNGKYWCLKKILNTWTEINLETHDFKKINLDLLINNFNKFECLVLAENIEFFNLLIKKYCDLSEILFNFQYKINENNKNIYQGDSENLNLKVNKIEIYENIKLIFNFFYLFSHISDNLKYNNICFKNLNEYFFSFDQYKFDNINYNELIYLKNSINYLIEDEFIYFDKESNNKLTWSNKLNDSYKKKYENLKQDKRIIEISNQKNLFTKEIKISFNKMIDKIIEPYLAFELKIKKDKEIKDKEIKELEKEVIEVEEEVIELEEEKIVEEVEENKIAEQVIEVKEEQKLIKKNIINTNLDIDIINRSKYCIRR